MPFLVLCASCAYPPQGGGAERGVSCELVHSQAFVTRADAEAYARDIWLSPTIWGHPRRSPQDVIRVVEVAAADAGHVAQALQVLTSDSRLQHELKVVYDVFIGGKQPYETTLAEARAYSGSDAVAMLEGDWGGQTYVVCPVRYVRCDEGTLRQLLADLDALEWPGQPEGAQLSFFRTHLGANVGGGMGGGLVIDGVWVHQRLKERGLEAAVAAVLAGERPTIT